MALKVHNVRGLDEALKHQMRIEALKLGIPLGEAVNQAMALWLVREVQTARAPVDATTTTRRRISNG